MDAPAPYGRTAVIGVGNPYRHDDGVGPAVVALLRRRAAARPLPGAPALLECDGDPGRLLEMWEGARLVCVVDAAHAVPSRPGRVHRLESGDGRLPGAAGATSSHGLGLGDALALARVLGRLPAKLIVYAVEAGRLGIGTGLSVPVAAAVEPVAGEVRADLGRHLGVPHPEPGRGEKFPSHPL